VFILDVAADAAVHEIDAARNMIKKLKTCRHPGVLQCVRALRSRIETYGTSPISDRTCVTYGAGTSTPRSLRRVSLANSWLSRSTLCRCTPC
jgi:hypothetical protein